MWTAKKCEGASTACFLLNHDEDVIPRGPARQAMYEEGCVVDFVELHTSVSEDAVCKTLEDVFSNILPNHRRIPGKGMHALLTFIINCDRI